MSVLRRQDVLGGILMMLAGGFFLWFGLDYRMGSARSMGPGYFPVILSCMLAAVGLAMAVKGVIAEGELVEIVSPRPVLAVIGSVIAFAVLVGWLGFVAASLAVVCIAAAAVAGARWLETSIYAVALTVAAAVLFIGLLGLPMRLVVG